VSKTLTAASLAADFCPKDARAQHAIGVIRRRAADDPIAAYYSLVLDCLEARVTGGRLTDGPFRDVAAPLFQRVSEYGLPQEPADVLKDLYLELFPRAQRHRLGEYYTPEWLAEKLLSDTLGRADLGDPSKRVLDPACGSGTFLVLVIKHVRRRVAAGHFGRRQALELILRNLAGFDVHPLAVRAARVNYLLALGDLLRDKSGPIALPIHEADSVRGGPDLPPFDYVVGNPPWVNWQHLSEEFRRQTMPLWEHYGLFPKRPTAMQTILGASKYDLSMLMTYVAADRYLRINGKLGFLVSQSLFKSAAGEGFRRFILPDGTPLAVHVVDDLVKLKPFDTAANRTAAVVLEKGRDTQFPVAYRFHRAGRQSCWNAQPVSADPSSAWIAAPPKVLAAITRILGASDYRAREGANTGGANAVFWIEAGTASRRQTAIRNVTEGARKRVPASRATVEVELVYPLLRGQNVSRWRAVPEYSILVTHAPGMKLRAIPEPEMKSGFPGAYSYLKRFTTFLRQRPAFKRYFTQAAPFYSLFNIGEYTFAPWKVVWREQSLPFTAAVVGTVAGKIVVPDHKLMLVAMESEDEAHYLCGALNSLPVSVAVAAYAIETQIATHVLKHIQVPRFNRKDRVHRHLISASRKSHAAAGSEDPSQLHRAEILVDRWAARLWQLDEDDLREMRGYLTEIGLPSHR
jgi:methylase of polypeptide subunit release factors